MWRRRYGRGALRIAPLVAHAKALEAAFGRDPLAELVTWDPQDPASVRTALRGLDSIVYRIGVPYWQFATHPILMQATLDGAIAEQVSRLLLIGTVYPFGRPQTARVSESHPREPHTLLAGCGKAAAASPGAF